MLEIKHPEIFESIVEEAKHATGGETRWIAAIDRAVEEINEHPERFHWQGTHMLIHSPTSDEVREANGRCSCTAFSFHLPCRHRAAARLWKRYLDALWSIPKPVKPRWQYLMERQAI